jgi:hypothetical protein
MLLPTLMSHMVCSKPGGQWAQVYQHNNANTRLFMLPCWAEAPIKIARMTLTIKLDGNWSSFQLANSAPPLSVTDSAIAPSARMGLHTCQVNVVSDKIVPWWAQSILLKSQPFRKLCAPIVHQIRSESRSGTLGGHSQRHHHGDFVGLACQV